MAQAEGITEELKTNDPMRWVRAMNSIRSRAEEIIRAEMIYCEGEGRAMILEAIYNGDFYPATNSCAEVRKVPERTESLREDYGPVGPEADKGGLRLVETLLDQSSIAQCEESECHFKVGFSAGCWCSRRAVEQIKTRSYDE